MIEDIARAVCRGGGDEEDNAQTLRCVSISYCPICPCAHHAGTLTKTAKRIYLTYLAEPADMMDGVPVVGEEGGLGSDMISR
jgi:hypothetical protein